MSPNHINGRIYSDCKYQLLQWTPRKGEEYRRITMEGSHVVGERIDGAFHTEGVLSPLRSWHLNPSTWCCCAGLHTMRVCTLVGLGASAKRCQSWLSSQPCTGGTILKSIIAQKVCHPRRAMMESHWNRLRLYLRLLCRPCKSVASNLATPNYQKNKTKPLQDYILSFNHQLQSLYNLTKSLTKRKSPMQGLLSICPVPLEHRQLQEIIWIEIRPQEMSTQMTWGWRWWGCRG